jgi:alpha-ketoglutarate-dependent taurine dioxygenase
VPPQAQAVGEMSAMDVQELEYGVPFGARISGLTSDNLADESVRRQLNDMFEKRGIIVFEDVEPTGRMQVKLSEVFGPLKDHPVKMVERCIARRSRATRGWVVGKPPQPAPKPHLK